MAIKGTWEGGIRTLGLVEEGVGIWDLDGVKWFAELADDAGKLAEDLTPDKVVEIVNETRESYIRPAVKNLIDELEEMIKSGQIAFKTPLTHEEYEDIIAQLEAGNLNAALEKGSID